MSVSFTTNPLTASSAALCGGSADYVTKSGTLTFTGASPQNVTVSVCGSMTKEGIERFVVTLANPVRATIAKATGTVTNPVSLTIATCPAAVDIAGDGMSGDHLGDELVEPRIVVFAGVVRPTASLLLRADEQKARIGLRSIGILEIDATKS